MRTEIGNFMKAKVLGIEIEIHKRAERPTWVRVHKINKYEKATP